MTILRLSSTVANNSFHDSIKKSRLKNLVQQGGRSAGVVPDLQTFPTLSSVAYYFMFLPEQLFEKLLWSQITERFLALTPATTA